MLIGGGIVFTLLKAVPTDEMPGGWRGLADGPKATKEIKAALGEYETITWTGPRGTFA